MARDYLSMWGRCRRHRAARGESPRGNWIYVAQNTSNIYVSCALRAHLLDIIVSPLVHCHPAAHPPKWRRSTVTQFPRGSVGAANHTELREEEKRDASL